MNLQTRTAVVSKSSKEIFAFFNTSRKLRTIDA